VSRWRILCLSLLLIGLGGETALVAFEPPQTATADLLAEALQRVQRGQFPEALQPLRQLNARRLPDELPPEWHQRLTFLLAVASFESADYAKATLHFERVRDSYPALQDYVLWYLAEGLRQLDRLSSARVVYQWLVDKFPDSVHRPEALVQAAETNARLGDLESAASLYRRYLQEQPEGAHRGEVLVGLGIVQRDLGNPAEALRQWRYVWVEHPEDPSAARIPELEKTLPASFVAPAVTSADLFRRAQRLYRLHRHHEALQAFAVAQASAPDQPLSPETRYQIGTSQYHVRDNTAALATFGMVYATAPRGPLAAAALLMQGRLHLRLEAEEDFLRTASALLDGFPNSKQADEIGYLTGHFYRNRGRTPEAVRAFQQTIDRGKASEYADDAWWYLGWLHYGLRDYGRAAQTWGKLLDAFPTSGLTPDTLYWQGRALEHTGQAGEAGRRYNRLRSSYHQTFYGYLAKARLEGQAAWAWQAHQGNGMAPVERFSPLVPDVWPAAGSDPHVRRGRELWAMRLFASAGEELAVASRHAAGDFLWQARAAQAYHWAGEHHHTMRILRRHGRVRLSQALGLPPAALEEMLYPLGALQRLSSTDFHGLDPLLVGALIMAESDWNPRAFSRVGARGLMQLMPDTGRRVAKQLGVEVSSDDQLFNPGLNLKLGVTYLGELSRGFQGQLPLVLASYNAGEEQVGKWWSKRAVDDMEEFIANIPFRETRRYVQRVYEYYAAYQRIYRDPPG
jgi:soluble lytic murein transglycosylase